MDPLQFAHVSRAHTALNNAFAIMGQDNRAKAFMGIAYAIAKAQRPEEARAIMLANSSSQVQGFAKAAEVGFDNAWGPETQSLVAAYLATIAPMSLLDSLASFAAVLPTAATRTLVASDAVADSIAEGLPKPVIRPGLDFGSAQKFKPAAIVVMSEEFFLAGADAGQRLLETELTSSIARASNAAVIDFFTTTSTILVNTTNDPLNDLRAGLRASEPSSGYVVAMNAGDCADLSTRVENRGGMGIRGGEFVPGLSIVAMDDYSGTLVIPASKVALRDFGLRLDGSWEASLDMRDSPSAPSQLVSLFQTDSRALLAERMFTLGGNATAVKVG